MRKPHNELHEIFSKNTCHYQDQHTHSDILTFTNMVYGKLVFGEDHISKVEDIFHNKSNCDIAIMIQLCSFLFKFMGTCFMKISSYEPIFHENE